LPGILQKVELFRFNRGIQGGVMVS